MKALHLASRIAGTSVLAFGCFRCVGIAATPGTQARLHNTMVGGNLVRTPAGVANNGVTHADLSGAYTTEGYNLIGDISGATGFTSGANHDILGTINAPVDARLLPLGWYGGLTETHLPRPGSPAIDAGDPGYYFSTDQRSVPRPQGTSTDIGAVEVRHL